MIVELANHSPHRSVDGRPAVTTIHIPDADDGSTHPEAKYNGPHPHDAEETGTLLEPGPRLGGYSHAPGMDVETFRKERQEASDFGRQVRLPGHEALQAIVNAWPYHAVDKPKWLQVTPTDLTPPGHAEDIERFLHEFFQTDGRRKPLEDEFQWRYWTPAGEPGVGFPKPPPDISALFTNDGRTQQAVNYGGGQTGLIGAGTAATSTSLTTNLTLVTNAWAGYRVYCYSTTSNNIVWANVISNTNAAGASVLTVDRWYVAATPGGSAGTTPTTPWAFVLADGGNVAAWFCGLTTTNITPAAADHALSGEYVVASAGMLRKICPYALTSGTSPMSFTLSPVFTANGSDTLPSTFYAAGFSNSMVVANTTLAMKFETSMSSSATINAIGDQITLVETGSGS